MCSESELVLKSIRVELSGRRNDVHNESCRVQRGSLVIGRCSDVFVKIGVQT